jgi:hypothetical protein
VKLKIAMRGAFGHAGKSLPIHLGVPRRLARYFVGQQSGNASERRSLERVTLRTPFRSSPERVTEAKGAADIRDSTTVAARWESGADTDRRSPRK